MNTTQHLQAIKAWSDYYLKYLVCDVCKNKKWSISDDLVTPAVFSKNPHFENLYPQMMLICNACGNTRYFNGKVLGIVNQSDLDDNRIGKKPIKVDEIKQPISPDRFVKIKRFLG